MNSPFVRRKRLASEVRALREAMGLNHEQLGKAAGFHRLKISRLETGERAPNVTDVMKILTALGVDGERWHELVRIAEDAAERGWWAEYGDDMGSRQRVYADLEAGATSVRTYEIFVFPGLLQIPEYALQRGVQAEGGRPPEYVERNIEARAVRQNRRDPRLLLENSNVSTRSRRWALVRGRQRRENLVHDRCSRAHRLHLPCRKGLIDPEPRPYYCLFSLWRSPERTRDLPADGLSHTQLAIERGQKDERLSALPDLATNTRVFGVRIARVRHEAR